MLSLQGRRNNNLIDEIKPFFDKIIKHNTHVAGHYNSAPILQQWWENKQQLIQALGEELIYELPNKVTLELDEKEKRNKFFDFCEEIEKYENIELLNFICWCGSNDFYNNRTTKDYIKGEYNIPKGIKIIKAFKFFEKDPIILDEIQTKASRVIQQDKVTGTMCLSVHPLDFLSSSENTHNWRSCHSLDGEYCAGNLSYMTDKTTVICYLRSDEPTILPRFPEDVPWNNKKWRMLLTVDVDNFRALFAGRQYPFFSKTALDIILQALRKLPFFRGDWSNWHDDYIDNSFRYKEPEPFARYDYGNRTFVMGRYYYILENLIQNDPSELHFNDLLRSSTYATPYYCWKSTDFGSIHPITIGNAPKCPVCGDREIIYTDTLTCSWCANRAKSTAVGECTLCGREVEEDENYLRVPEDLVCENCGKQFVHTCNVCGERFIYWDLKYNRETHDYTCAFCVQKEGD